MNIPTKVKRKVKIQQKHEPETLAFLTDTLRRQVSAQQRWRPAVDRHKGLPKSLGKSQGLPGCSQVDRSLLSRYLLRM